jgi:membrane protease YdiL (CAAX protease family)
VRGGARLIGFSLALLVSPAPGFAQLPEAALPDPGRSGSHAAYLERLDSARESEYARLLARYDAHVAAHPRDVGAAIERCRFIEGAEPETPVEPGACAADLLRRFPADPEVLLFRAESLEPGDVLALEREVGAAEWSAAQRARLLERAALALFERGQVDAAFERARRAVALDPSRPLGRVLAEGWRRAGERERAVEALVADLDALPSWEFAPRAELLLELGAPEQALAVIAAAQARSDAWIDPVLHGRALEAAGRHAQARERYREAADAPWFREQAQRRLFELALASGSEADARRAYLALRESEGDVLARRRIALARAFPALPWDARDLLALVTLAASIFALAALPLLWVLPLHYLGLRRGRADAPDLDGERRWGARDLWYAGALLGLIQFSCLYVFLYPDLERWLGMSGEAAGTRDPAALASYGLAVGTLCALGALLPLRRADWRRVFACRWGVARTVASCAAALLVLRLAAWLSVSLANGPGPGGAASMTEEVLGALGARYGLVALFAYAALLVPLCEELLFRGMMLGAASRFVGFAAASLFQALLFALLHESLALAPFYLLVGLVCAWLRRASGGLRVPFLVHAGNNAIAVSALLRGV